MQGYIARRILALIPTLIFASFIVFMTVRLIPGDIIDLMLSQNDVSASKQSRVDLEMALGLDQPIYIQYFAGSARCCSTAASAIRCGRIRR
jgi:peptide/nickel transport system permease protein